MPGVKTIVQVAAVTMAVMFMFNMIAAQNAKARKVVKGGPVVIAA